MSTTRTTDTWTRVAGIFAGAVFGLYWIPIRALEQAGFPGLWATFVFNLLPLVVLLPFLVWRRQHFSVRRVHFHINGLLIGISLVLYASSFLYTDVVRAVVLFYLTPIWGFILARIFIGDVITRIRWCAVVLGMAGLLVIIGTENGFPWPSRSGDWMALASGVVWAIASLRLLMDKKSDSLNYCISFFLWCSIASGIFASLATSNGHLVAADWSSLREVAIWFLPVAAILLIPGALAVVYSASRLNPGVAGILFMAEICVATIASALLTEETIGLREIFGVALVIMAGVVEPFKDWMKPASITSSRSR